VHKFVRNLITEWRRLELPIGGERVIVAVSGGADSTALLFALADLRDRKKLTHELVIAHFNHQLRGVESGADERFVSKVATDMSFEYVSGSGDLKGKSDLEQRARDERYSFLARVAKEKKASFVLTGHTIDDQAETFLLNLIRGSGVDGLCAMPVKRPLSDEIVLVRPLLSWARRQDTEDYCRESGVKFRRDRMNVDLNFTRVKIRRQVLPKLAELNPKIIETLARTAEVLALSSDKTNDKTPYGSSPTLKLTDLKKMSDNDRYTYIRSWLRDQRRNLRGIELKHIEAIARLVKSPKSGRIVELPGGGRVVKGGGGLAFRHIKLE
jgi:tRNA(Ile)-lysidine synthase